MSALDFAALLLAEKRKARSAVAAPAPAPAPEPKQQQRRPPPDAATAALDPSKRRPPLQTLPGAPPTIAYAADWISEAEEAAIVTAAKRGDDWVTVRGRRLRRLGGPAGEAGFAPEPLPRWARDACAAAAASDPSRPAPNHVLVNAYDFSKESYVLPHTDGPAYDDRTFTLSCGADAVVVFKERLKTSDIGVRAAATRCEVLLRRRSLLAFSREAYTECTHEIGAAPDTIGPRCANLDAAGARVGDVVGRAGERVSFTLRCAGGAE